MAYDMCMAKASRLFCTGAATGRRSTDGLGMLVGKPPSRSSFGAESVRIRVLSSSNSVVKTLRRWADSDLALPGLILLYQL
jgi:hypothetical protein